MRPALWLALAVSVGATAWLALQPDDDVADDAAPLAAVVPPAPRRPVAAPGVPPQAAAQRPGPPATAGLPARAADWPAPAAAALLAWGAPPPAPPPPAVPAAGGADAAAPRAPAFPYQWIGSLEDERGRQVLLGGPLRSAAVRQGQVLDGQWRIEGVRDGRLELTWLPGGLTVIVRGQTPTRSGSAATHNNDDNPGPDS